MDVSLTLWGLRLLGLALAALICLEPWWLWPLPQDFWLPAALLAAVAIALLAQPLLMRLPAHLPRLRTGRLLGAALLVAAVYVLHTFRVGRYSGDAGVVVSFVKNHVVFHKREPLSPGLYLAAHQTFGRFWEWQPLETIQWVTATAGALGLWALWSISRQLAGPTPVAVAAFLALATGGTVQLFFGHVENYTVPCVLALWCLSFGLKSIREHTSALPALALFTLAAAFHLSLLAFLPAMGWLMWHRRPPLWPALAVTVLPAAAVIIGMFSVGYLRANESGFGGGDGRMFVQWEGPLDGFSKYLFLRIDHLAAIANLQLLVGPLWLATLLGLGLRRLTPDLTWLALAAGGFFALTLLWNPDLGPFRDWDLFGPVGFYLGILAVSLVIRRAEPPQAFAFLLFAAVVNLMRTLPFLAFNLAHG